MPNAPHRLHRWLREWPGNYCLCCGAPDPAEDACLCRDCIFDPETGVTFCAEHERLLAIPCPCPCGHEAHTPAMATSTAPPRIVVRRRLRVVHP